MAKDADMNAKKVFSSSAFHFALRKGQLVAMEFLLAHGADSLAKDMLRGMTALHFAVENGQLAAMECLLAHGADSLAKGMLRGMTALHFAVGNGQLEAMGCLMAHGADLNAKDEDGKTAFHNTARNGHMAAMECLLAHGADPLAKDERYGKTAFHFAVEYGECPTAVVLVLLAAGADRTANSKFGQTAFDVAGWQKE